MLHIHAVDSSSLVVATRTDWMLTLVVATYMAAGLATATAGGNQAEAAFVTAPPSLDKSRQR